MMKSRNYKATNDEIDFVILWVDCNDLNWQIKKRKYNHSVGDSTIARYRDWNNLKYWFRAVDKYASWVHRIHFVSDGQIPEWLNIHHPKIHIVDHRDYIPDDCLPLFNSDAIEIGIHLIPDLSEKFVYFNDDMFLNDYIRKDYYFKKGFPCDRPELSGKVLKRDGTLFTDIRWNNYNIINKYFKKSTVIAAHFSKFFNFKYGARVNIRNALNLCTNHTKFNGIYDQHVSIPYLKSEWSKVWECESELLSNVRKTTFRSEKDVSQWLVRYWRICEGKFIPKACESVYFGVNKNVNIATICHAITRKQYKEICINDDWSGDGYEDARDAIISAFEITLPEKSPFEI